MSRHHILPPVIYTPPPPKPKETRRRRRIGDAQGASATEETEEPGTVASVRETALPQHSRAVETVERRNSSTSGKLSADTLQALLAAQEESGNGADWSAA